ncbi:MAG TPA: hypothetical protein VGR25_09790, partial [bacterium]|nr:hypothetical protein [bacterium]
MRKTVHTFRRSSSARALPLVAGVLLLLLVGIVSVYLWYVRGLGIHPDLSAQSGMSWYLRAPMPQARTEVAVAALRGRIYVIGGFDGFARTTATVQIYDPQADAWSNGPPLPQPVHHAMAATLGERL